MIELENYIEKDKGSLVCKSKKYLYGLKQSPRMWYQMFCVGIGIFEIQIKSVCVLEI